jgi:cell wall-associated NlpC family hydrolase
MKPFYCTEEKTIALNYHASKLVDTPFAPHAMAPGMGIDCIHVNAYVYLQTGFLKPPFTPPRYQLDSGNHTKESQLLKWLDENKQFDRLASRPPENPKAGDAICFNLGLSEHHVGLMLNEKQFIHVLATRRGRVIISNVSDFYYSHRVTAVFRPLSGGSAA